MFQPSFQTKVDGRARTRDQRITEQRCVQEPALSRVCLLHNLYSSLFNRWATGPFRSSPDHSRRINGNSNRLSRERQAAPAYSTTVPTLVTRDCWRVNAGRTVYHVSASAVASSNAQLSGLLVSILSRDCRSVFARLGTFWHNGGFSRQALGDEVFSADATRFRSASGSAKT
jgi:hypothetical protein